MNPDPHKVLQRISERSALAQAFARPEYQAYPQRDLLLAKANRLQAAATTMENQLASAEAALVDLDTFAERFEAELKQALYSVGD